MSYFKIKYTDEKRDCSFSLEKLSEKAGIYLTEIVR